MNRELTFRIWTGERMEYSIGVSNYGAFFCGGIDPKDSASLGFTTLYSKDYPVMQYTGLNDRNGIGIYEGDVVANESVGEEYCSPAVVVWSKYEDMGFALAFKRAYEIKPHMKPLRHIANGIELIQEFNLSRHGVYKVIGNIFQNKIIME